MLRAILLISFIGGLVWIMQADYEDNLREYQENEFRYIKCKQLNKLLGESVKMDCEMAL